MLRESNEWLDESENTQENDELEMLVQANLKILAFKGNKVLCTITNHEMRRDLATVRQHLNGAKVRKFRQLESVDLEECLEYKIVLHREKADMLYCNLTNSTIARNNKAVKQHVKGQRYNEALLVAHEVDGQVSTQETMTAATPVKQHDSALRLLDHKECYLRVDHASESPVADQHKALRMIDSDLYEAKQQMSTQETVTAATPVKQHDSALRLLDNKECFLRVDRPSEGIPTQPENYSASNPSGEGVERLIGVPTPKGKKTKISTPAKTPVCKTHWTIDEYGKTPVTPGTKSMNFENLKASTPISRKLIVDDVVQRKPRTPLGKITGN